MEKENNIGPKFVIGFISLIGLVYIHAFVKDLPLAILVLPAMLMGDVVDIVRVIKAIRGNENK